MEVLSISVQDINNRLGILQETAVEVAAVLTNNINFQINKTDKSLTDSKTMMLKEYYNFLDMFSKRVFNTVTAYSKYNYKI